MMTKKDKVRMLKLIVWYCLIATAVFGAVGLIVCWHIGSDPSNIVHDIIQAYVLELGLSAFLKLLEKKERSNGNGGD